MYMLLLVPSAIGRASAFNWPRSDCPSFSVIVSTSSNLVGWLGKLIMEASVDLSSVVIVMRYWLAAYVVFGQNSGGGKNLLS